MNKKFTIILFSILLAVTINTGLFGREAVAGVIGDSSANHVSETGETAAAVGTARAADRDDSKVVVEGLISKIRGKTIAIGRTVFKIDKKDRKLRRKARKLSIGYMVEITATMNADGSYRATGIKLLDKIRASSGKGNETLTDVGVLTDFESTSGSQLLLTLDDARQYLTYEGNKLQGRDGLNCTAADLVVGMTLRIKYKTGPGSSSGPSEVFSLEVVGNETIKGRIEEDSSPAGSLPSITVLGKSIYYDSCTELVGAKGGVTDPGDLAIGTPVQVKAAPLANGTYLANRVVASNSSLAEGQPVSERGIVSSIFKNGTEMKTFVVNDQTFYDDSGTKYEVHNYAGPFPKNDFMAGLDVLANGESYGKKITAEMVTVYLSSYDYSGDIEEIGSNFVVVAGIKFYVTQYTVFDEFGYEATLADLSVGDPLVVTAIEWPNGSMIATKVVPGESDPGGGGPGGSIEINGMIYMRYFNDATGYYTLQVDVGQETVEISVSYETVITDSSGAPASFLDLQVGKTIKAVCDEVNGLIIANGIIIY